MEARNIEKVDEASQAIVRRRESAKERDELIMEYAWLVKRIAYRIIVRLPDSISLDDLISIGTVGLIDAVGKYNPEKGKGFRAYAELRIKGAILDELRGYDNLSRANRRRANELNQTIQDLELKHGTPPTEEQITESMGISIEELHRLRSNTRQVVFLDIDDTSYSAEANLDIHHARPMEQGEFEPYRNLANKALKEQLASCIDRLPEQLKLVLSLYYYSELNYKEIGRVLELSESRISQLHSKAVLKLRKFLSAIDAT